MPVRRTILGVAMAAAAVTSAALAYPKPSAVPPRWELEFDAGEFRLYVDPLEGGSYWTFTYRVTNRSGRDQTWAPRLVLFTDRGEILASGRSVPMRVTTDVMDLLGDEMLESQNEIIGALHHGREYAKDGLVIWPAGDLEVNQLSLFVAGISGETATFEHPRTGSRVVLHKTLQRDYLIPGEAKPRGSKPVKLTGERWVMR